jgi:RimJ/RimL family protein N-acetyltransferase
MKRNSGTLETKADCTHVHIVAGHSFAGSLKLALSQMEGPDSHQLIVLAEHYAIGPLGGLDSREGRAARSQWFGAHIADGGKAYDHFEEEYTFLTARIAQIPSQAEVVIWAGDNVSEQAGLRHALYLLQDKPNPVSVYNACAICEKLFNRPNAFIQYRHSGEIPPDKLRQALLAVDGSGRLTLEERSRLEQEWLDIAGQKGNLRIWEHGAVTEMPEDYFDRYLLEKLDVLREPGDGRFLKAARLLGEAIGYCEQNIPDYFFEYRLRELVNAGVLEMQAEMAAMRYYSIKRKSHTRGEDPDMQQAGESASQHPGIGKAEYSLEATPQNQALQLRTPRLLLKSGDEVTAEAVLDYFLRNKEFLAEWEVLRQPQFYTVEAQKKMLAEDKVNSERGQLVKLWLCKAEEPDRVIGSVALSNIVRGAFQSCHLGYRLDGTEQGKGFMTEAVKELTAYAFQNLSLHRIEANIMPRNTASLKVTEKLGFYHEGLAKQYLRINGKWEDHIHMVLLNEEME